MEREKNQPLEGKRILVAASGSIAAVKTPLLVSSLIKAGAEVKCLITPSASKLVSPLSLATISRNRCFQEGEQWCSKEPKPLHIYLAEWADILVIAPLSATSLGKWSHGIGEGLLASVLLAFEKPIVAAAAMNTGMWLNKNVQANWEKVSKISNIIGLSPSQGLLACDRIGDGRMINLEVIEAAIESALFYRDKGRLIKQDLNDQNFLITAGPTLEQIDLVRHVTNRSSGLMGVLLAQAAKMRGASINLVHGPLNVPIGLLEGLNQYPVKSSSEMEETISCLQERADLILMSAAVGDIHKQGDKGSKIPKGSLVQEISKGWELSPDLLANINKRKKSGQIVMGFAAATGSNKEIKEIGEEKRRLKGCDLLFASPVDQKGQGFESKFNGGFLLGPNEMVITFPKTSKICLAHLLIDALIDYKYKIFANS